MSLKDSLKRFAFLVPLAIGALTTNAARADGDCAGGSCSGAPTCCSHCCIFGCPGPYVHCTPKVPCLKFKCTCGKPVCDLCDMPGYGYYPTCWRAWDQPLNYRCPVPTPTQLVAPPPETLVPSDEIQALPRTNFGQLPQRY